MAEASLDIGNGEFFSIQKLCHQVVIALSDVLYQGISILEDLLLIIFWNGKELGGGIVLVAIDDGLIFHQVHKAFELILASNRQLNRYGAGVKPVGYHIDGSEEVGAHSIHLVNETYPGDAVFIRLTPDRF
jgi:hypothetical protein